MRLRTFKHNNNVKVGIVKDNFVYTLPFNSMNELIDSNKSTHELLDLVSDKINVEETETLAPIPNPKQDIICLGINYMAHAEESARYKKKPLVGIDLSQYIFQRELMNVWLQKVIFHHILN